MSRSEEPLITKEMIGLFVVFGADLILLVVLLAAVGVMAWSSAAFVSLFVLAGFGGWIGIRWYMRQTELVDSEKAQQRDERPQEAKANADPLETLKGRYAAGELSDDEFEEKLDRLLDSDRLAESGQSSREDANEELSAIETERE